MTKNPHTILAVNAGIGSSAGLFQDGRAVFCIEEERLNRTKNWIGIPEKAVRLILKRHLAGPADVDAVVLTGDNHRSNDRAGFYAHYDRFFQEALRTGGSVGRTLAGTDAWLNDRVKTPLSRIRRAREQGPGDDEAFLTGLGFSRDVMTRVNHHQCHAAAAYYGLADDPEAEYLVFTLDGGGDNMTSGVYKACRGRLDLVSSSHAFSIGNVYSALTYYLGFTPHEHEYKLMGLAPYAKREYALKYRDFLARFVDLAEDDTRFVNPMPLSYPRFYRALLDEINHDRFDNVSAGLQLFAEEMIERWVLGNIRQHEIDRILCGGGVFMNVKVNQRLASLAEVKTMNVFPSCGDESNIFGGAFFVYNETTGPAVGLLGSYTLGPIAEDDLSETLETCSDSVTHERLDDPNGFIARELAKGRVVARCSGPMEFGARALGNRSILADPRHLPTVGLINRAIKNRDFWMPFAPAMLWDRAGELVRVPGSLAGSGSPYMMFAFDTLEKARPDLTCGLHQADRTARIQGVDRKRYPDLYDIIERFGRESGVPAVLNTSFNLHGHPIVATSRQAVDVLVNSGLETLVIGDRLIRKRN